MDPTKDTRGPLERAYDESIKASRDAGVVTDIDAGAVALGRVTCQQIDTAAATFEGQDLTKALYLTPHVMNVLKELLATPASRAATAKAAPKTSTTGAKTVETGTDEVGAKREQRGWKSA